MSAFKFMKSVPFKQFGFISLENVKDDAIVDKDEMIVVTLDGISIKELTEKYNYPHVVSFHLGVPYEQDDYERLFEALKYIKQRNPQIDTVVFQCRYGQSRSRALALTFTNLFRLDTDYWHKNPGEPMEHIRLPWTENIGHDYEFVQDRLAIKFAITQ